MRKIFKPQNVISNEKLVVIPDVEFKEDPKPMVDENGNPIVVNEELYESIREEIRSGLANEIGMKRLEAFRERDAILADAKKEAKKMLDDAALNRRGILDEANNSSVQIKRDAYQDGLKKGIEEKADLLEKLAGSISECIEQLKADEQEYFEEYAKQLKYIGIEVSEKVIYQKISEDDMVMYNVVKNAVKSVRDVSWIKAEVSEKLAGYIDSLENELAVSGIKADVALNSEVPQDHCVLNTSDGVIVATISQQIANIRDYISRQDKSGNDE